MKKLLFAICVVILLAGVIVIYASARRSIVPGEFYAWDGRCSGKVDTTYAADGVYMACTEASTCKGHRSGSGTCDSLLANWYYTIDTPTVGATIEGKLWMPEPSRDNDVFLVGLQIGSVTQIAKIIGPTASWQTFSIPIPDGTVGPVSLYVTDSDNSMYSGGAKTDTIWIDMLTVSVP